MKIAVLLSSYNGEKYIKEQIDSILKQEGSFELSLIVRDDGSTDETINILKKYEREEKLTWYSGENLRSAKSFLNLICSTSGYDYYAFADQDDYWEPNKIEKGITSLGKYNCPAIYLSNGCVVDSKLVSLGRNVYKEPPKSDMYSVLCGAGLQGCAMLFNERLAALIRREGIPKIVTNHDSYIARVCTAIGGTIVFDDVPLLKYRQHENNVIGVTSGVIKNLKNRLKEIFTKDTISIALTAETILSKYEKDMPEDCVKWYRQVLNYRKSIINRIRLASSMKTQYINLNWSITIRLKILLGNR